MVSNSRWTSLHIVLRDQKLYAVTWPIVEGREGASTFNPSISSYYQLIQILLLVSVFIAFIKGYLVISLKYYKPIFSLLIGYL